jgi:hypothetical protein
MEAVLTPADKAKAKEIADSLLASVARLEHQ